MDPGVILFVIVVVLIAGTAQTVAGFGFALIAVPFLVTVLGVRETIVVATILGIANAALVQRGAWRHTPRPTVVTMLAGSLAGMPLGLLVLLHAPQDALRLAVGVASIAMAAAIVFGGALSLPGRRGEALAGLISGALNTSVGMNGPPVVLYLQDRRLPPQAFRAALSAFFLVTNIVTLALLAASGVVNSDAAVLAAAALPSVLIGSVAGHALLPRLSHETFRRMVLVLLVVTSAGAVASAIARLVA
jgi:uncharacterized membrane protein YfcA